MAAFDLAELRLLRTAPIGGVLAAVGETADRLGVDGGGDLALELDLFLHVVDVGHGDGRQQALCVGVARI